MVVSRLCSSNSSSRQLWLRLHHQSAAAAWQDRQHCAAGWAQLQGLEPQFQLQLLLLLLLCHSKKLLLVCPDPSAECGQLRLQQVEVSGQRHHVSGTCACARACIVSLQQLQLRLQLCFLLCLLQRQRLRLRLVLLLQLHKLFEHHQLINAALDVCLVIIKSSTSAWRQ